MAAVRAVAALGRPWSQHWRARLAAGSPEAAIVLRAWAANPTAKSSLLCKVTVALAQQARTASQRDLSARARNGIRKGCTQAKAEGLA